MTRETVTDAIQRHASRGMSRRQLTLTYGVDAVLRVLGSEEEAASPLKAQTPLPFPQRLTDARVRAGLSLSSLAVRIGAHHNEVGSYEAGLQVPSSARRIALLAEFMGERFDALDSELKLARTARAVALDTKRKVRVA